MPIFSLFFLCSISPVGTGDKNFQEKAKARMEGLISAAKIFVFASHSEDLIKKFYNRIFELNHGSVTEVT